MVEELNKQLSELKKTKEEKKFPGEGKVIVKSGAYQKMLLHVLRYASNTLPRDEWVEVMGMCIGKIEGDDVVVYDAVPISHGNRIEVAFAPEDYAAFATVDEQAAERDMFTVGWYHSHPGLTIFWSKVDVQNQLGFQTDGNPKAFGIVFDHTTIEAPGDLGFKNYRLDDPGKGMTSDYHEVETVVEPPETVEFFETPRAIVDASVDPNREFVYELSEQVSLDEGTAGGEGEGVTQVEDFAEKLQPVSEGFSRGAEAVATKFLDPLVTQMGTWAGDVKRATTKGGHVLATTVSAMNEGVEDGLGRVKTWFDENFSEKVADHEKMVGETVRGFETKYREILGKAQEIVDALGEELVQQLKDALTKEVSTVKENVLRTLKDIASFGSKIKSIKDGVEAQAGHVKTLVTTTGENQKAFAIAAEETSNDLRRHMDQALKITSDELEDLEGQQAKLADAVKKVETALKAVRDLF